MPNVCRNCLRNAPEGEELCQECKTEMENDPINKLSNKASQKYQEMNDNRKYCAECGAQLGFFSIFADPKNRLLCGSCLQKEREEQQRLEEERQEALRRERIQQMYLGKSFVIVRRVESINMAAERTTLYVKDDNSSDPPMKIPMNSGDEIVLEFAPGTYTFTHKTHSMLAGTKPFTIDLEAGDSYYIDYKPVLMTGPLVGLAYLLFRVPSMECYIRSRETVRNGELMVYNT